MTIQSLYYNNVERTYRVKNAYRQTDRQTDKRADKHTAYS